MTESLTWFERELLAELAASGDQPPAGLALALDADLDTVLDTVATLQDREFVTREGQHSGPTYPPERL